VWRGRWTGSTCSEVEVKAQGLKKKSNRNGEGGSDKKGSNPLKGADIYKADGNGPPTLNKKNSIRKKRQSAKHD